MIKNNHKGGEASAIRAVILDYGEVLCFQPAPEAIRRMAGVFQIDPERFFEVYVPTRGLYDQGLLTAEEYWQDFARRAGVTIDAALVGILRRWDTEMWSRVNVEMIEWVERLRAAGFTTALLSNMQFDMAAHARKNFAWLAHFDQQILSCELRLIKPDPAIFRRSVERLGVKPQEALLVDDRDANVETAKELGFHAIRFQSIEQLRVDLEGMGFEILPRDSNSKVC